MWFNKVAVQLIESLAWVFSWKSAAYFQNTFQGRIRRFWKGVALYFGHHGWPTKKILGFRWSKKAKITLKTISFWQNISISLFKFSPFLYAMKACQWNLIRFFKIYKERDKTLMQQSMRKEKVRKVWLCFITGYFMKSFNMIINHFFCFASSFAAQFLLFDIRMTPEI